MINFKKFADQENIIYAILLALAIVLAVTNYGASSTIQTVAVFYCILQLVINVSVIYSSIKSLLRKQRAELCKRKKVNLIVSFLAIGILFFIVLTDYFKDFVLYYSAIILGFLLLYDIGKMVFKRSF